ncbi:MAG: hypothetical protein ACKO00_04325, partial [Crocinitomicaceae bacterium]
RFFLSTTLPFPLVQPPSSPFANFYHKYSALTASKIASPRNSKRSFESSEFGLAKLDLCVTA